MGVVQSRAPAVIGVPVQELRRVLVAELEGGTLTSSAGDLVSLLVQPPWGVWNVVVVGGWS